MCFVFNNSSGSFTDFLFFRAGDHKSRAIWRPAPPASRLATSHKVWQVGGKGKRRRGKSGIQVPTSSATHNRLSWTDAVCRDGTMLPSESALRGRRWTTAAEKSTPPPSRRIAMAPAGEAVEILGALRQSARGNQQPRQGQRFGPFRDAMGPRVTSSNSWNCRIPPPPRQSREVSRVGIRSLHRYFPGSAAC